MNKIEIDHLTFTYPGAEEPTLKDLSLTVEDGDFLAVVGNNGCGKSTLCKTLNGLIPHFIVGDMEGMVKIDGVDTREQEIGSLAKKAGATLAPGLTANSREDTQNFIRQYQ